MDELWNEFISTNNKIVKQTENDHLISYNEGKTYNVIQTRYERSVKAREKCIEEYGLNCFACELNLEDIYGEIGKDYIQVHHLNPFANNKGEHETNPIIDLRPLCPNCHAMIHRKNPPFTIEEMKILIKN